MRKVIGAMNMTLDGICDHTAGIADAALHQHYTDLLGQGEVILYGRTTYQLMQFWQGLIQQPSGEKNRDDFAAAIDRIPKIVFSNTLENTQWNSAQLANKTLEKEVLALREQSGKDILVGSRSLIVQLLNLGLLDEFQIAIHPMIQAGGLGMFDQIKDTIHLKLARTKTFESGVIILYYQPV